MKKSITIIFACIFLWACNSKESNSQEKIEALEAQVEQKQQQKKENDLEQKELELQQKEEELHKKEQSIQSQKPQNQTISAVINDPDGYTNVRKGKGTQFPVVDVIYENQYFQVYKNTMKDNWCLVYNPENGIKGYMHKSRIVIK